MSVPKSYEELLALAAATDKIKIPAKPKAARKKRKRAVKTYNGKGYEYVYKNGKPVLANRIVMQEKLGRDLLPHEAVYFKDRNKRNLEPENLVLGLKQGFRLDTLNCPHCDKLYI